MAVFSGNTLSFIYLPFGELEGLCSAMCGNNDRLAVEGISDTTNAFRSHGHGTFHGILPESVAHLVHGLIEFDHLFAVFKKVDLLAATHQMAQPHSDQPDKHPSVVELIEEFVHGFDDGVVGTRVRNAKLFAGGLEIGIADLDRNA